MGDISFIDQEELEVPYEIKDYKRGSDKLAPPELKAIHPLGKSPVISDGDLVIAESGTIVGKPVSDILVSRPNIHTPYIKNTLSRSTGKSTTK